MANPRLESRKASDLAYIEHQGPYDKIPWEQYIQQLYGWAKENKVMPGLYPMAIYPDSPECTPADKLRSEVAITFKGKASARGNVKMRKLPAMKVATVSHKGPGSEFKNTYGRLMAWIAEKGLEMSGPPMEIYSKKPEVVAGQTILYAKVMVPVKKK